MNWQCAGAAPPTVGAAHLLGGPPLLGVRRRRQACHQDLNKIELEFLPIVRGGLQQPPAEGARRGHSSGLGGVLRGAACRSIGLGQRPEDVELRLPLERGQGKGSRPPPPAWRPRQHGDLRTAAFIAPVWHEQSGLCPLLGGTSTGMCTRPNIAACLPSTCRRHLRMAGMQPARLP